MDLQILFFTFTYI